MLDLFAPAAPAAPHPAADVPLDFTEGCLRGATFSACRHYRFDLWRLWQPALPFVQFVCLNPSTADERLDDRTVARVMSFARRWGMGGVVMTNLFAYRATDPRDMKAVVLAVDPFGDRGANDRRIIACAEAAAFVVLAYGAHGSHQGRGEALAGVLRDHRRQDGAALDLRALAVNADGSPKHPLYVLGDTPPLPFAPAAG